MGKENSIECDCHAEHDLRLMWDVGPVPTGQFVIVRWEPDLHVLKKML